MTSCLRAQPVPMEPQHTLPSCSLFERMQVGCVQKSAVHRSVPGFWMRLQFIAKALFSLTGKPLVPLVKGKIWEADIRTLARVGRKK